MRNKRVMIAGAAIVLSIALTALLSGVLAPYDPDEITGRPFQAPSPEHILGTNDIGQDIFSELLVGAKYSLLVGFFATCISGLLGILIGLNAEWYGGGVDSVLMKLTAFVYTIPYLPLVIVMSALLRGSMWTTALVIGVSSWPEMARVFRAQTMNVKKSDYITSISAMGASNLYILTKHISRELLPLISYRVIERFRKAIIAESTLSFLGLASSTVKSWGTMLYYAQAKSAFLTGAWVWWVIPPGIMITLLTFVLMLIGYGMEGKIDPRLERSV